MGSDGIEPPHRDFQSPALPFELQALNCGNRNRTYNNPESKSGALPVELYRTVQSYETAIMSSIGTSRYTESATILSMLGRTSPLKYL